MSDPTTTHFSQTYRVRASRLEGEVRVSGAKNSVLRLLAASLLTDGELRLSNYPASLVDAQIHVAMLQQLGKAVSVSDDSISITEPNPLQTTLNWQGKSIRSTLLILGALVSRMGAGAVPLPGGCNLGERKFDLHELVFRRLGCDVWTEGGMLYAESKGRLTGGDIHLPIRSTGATENAILCGTLARGKTTVWNPHVRPEILDVIRCLRTMGANIIVHGQERIEINGVEALNGGNHRIIPDNMEAITWLISSVITDGDVEILDFPWSDLSVPLIHLRESGAQFFRGSHGIIVRGGTCYPVEISTGPYPGINSDMQPLFAVYGSRARGESRIIDLRFPGRYGYASELEKLGVVSEIKGNLLRIQGGSSLRGAKVQALDLRAGVALTLAGLVAEGETVIDDAWQIERGYDNFANKLRALGGDIIKS